MDLTGKVIAVCEAKSGVSARTGSQWKVQEYVIETFDQFPRKCCFSIFGEDKIAQFNIQAGETITVSFDIDAHEYNGRWFNSIRAWNVQRVDPAQAQAMGTIPTAAPTPFPPQQAAQPAGTQTSPFPPVQTGSDATTADSSDDLPF